MAPRRRALVTGMGTVSCLGSGTDRFWEGISQASMRPSLYPDPQANMPHRLVYHVPDEDAPSADGWTQPGAQGAGGPVGRATRFALEATRQAISDAGLSDVPPSRMAVAIGTGMGDAGLHEQWRLDGAPPMQQWTPEFSVAAAVGAAIGAAGLNASISNACAASGFALSVAADLIESGEADVVVAGGAEGYSRVALGCFNRLGAIDPERCRPFDRARAGTVFGEGAAILVLEAEEHALERGAPRVYARVAGAGWSCDAYHMTAPEPRGEQILRALRDALSRAGGDADAIGCVVPHGTGTELNDVVEANALRALLGPRCGEVPLYSLKGLIGHTGGAAGAFAALASALILAHDEVPANVALGEQDPECDVLVAEEPLPLAGPLVVLNAYAFGGNNVSLALEAA